MIRSPGTPALSWERKLHAVPGRRARIPRARYTLPPNSGSLRVRERSIINKAHRALYFLLWLRSFDICMCTDDRDGIYFDQHRGVGEGIDPASHQDQGGWSLNHTGPSPHAPLYSTEAIVKLQQHIRAFSPSVPSSYALFDVSVDLSSDIVLANNVALVIDGHGA
jgi:hypothetical protein